MYSSSSQKKFWTFSCEEELTKLRHNANIKYITKFENYFEGSKNCFLTPEEELVIVKHYEHILRNFLQRFMPRREPLPRDVKGTTFHFFKRFFLVSSVMDYHPKEMMITCIFLACKICEYNLPIDVFVRNIEGDPRLLKNIILDQELDLLYRLNFRLNIHTPHRAVEGIMIDLRTRSNLQQPERLYEHIYRFLSSMWFTDVCLLYAPPQIALAAIMHATSRCKENIDTFILQTLLNYPSEKVRNDIVAVVRKIRSKVMAVQDPPPKDQIIKLEQKLVLCRNPKNDPSSKEFKQRMMERTLETYAQDH